MPGMVTSVHLPSFHTAFPSYPLPPHLVPDPAIYSGRSPPFQPQMPGCGGTEGRACGPNGWARNSAASSSTQSGFFHFGGPSASDGTRAWRRFLVLTEYLKPATSMLYGADLELMAAKDAVAAGAQGTAERLAAAKEVYEVSYRQYTDACVRFAVENP